MKRMMQTRHWIGASWMGRLCLYVCLSFFPVTIQAQSKPTEKPADVDVDNERAAQIAERMEAELGKYKDTTPEAADVMVRLVDFYYERGQMFGLTRIGQRFVAIHTSDPRHQSVMVKLAAGLEAGARNKEFVATVRQFIQRYPKASEGADFEIRMAKVLDEMLDYHGAGEAHQIIWQRRGPDEIGLRSATKAIQHFAQVGSRDDLLKAVQIAMELIEKTPEGPLMREIVFVAMAQAQRINEWPKTIQAGSLALQKGVQLPPDRKRLLHFTMGENFNRMGQYANAV
ncbi:MAG: hypothetical protein FJ267_17710, partial [Planctomycetes bacterium]|nr:hypothetical protein [Planctomycetota bacterium]